MSDKLDEIAEQAAQRIKAVTEKVPVEFHFANLVRDIIRAALDEARQEARRKALEECVTETPPDFMLAVKSKWIREAVAEERKALREIVVRLVEEQVNYEPGENHRARHDAFCECYGWATLDALRAAILAALDARSKPEERPGGGRYLDDENLRTRSKS